MRTEDMIRDAEVAYSMLEDEENEQRFRILWIANLAILRGIGHVLDKADKLNPRYTMAINRWWQELKASKGHLNEVFWDFIQNERNLVLKEYEFNYSVDTPILGDGEIYQLGDLYKPLDDGTFVSRIAVILFL